MEGPLKFERRKAEGGNKSSANSVSQRLSNCGALNYFFTAESASLKLGPSNLPPPIRSSRSAVGMFTAYTGGFADRGRGGVAAAERGPTGRGMLKILREFGVRPRDE
jgi:hypothetical protein